MTSRRRASRRPAMNRLIPCAASSLLVVAACGPASNPGPDAARDAGASVDGAAMSPLDADAPVDAPRVHIADDAATHALVVRFPDVALAPQQETTLCVQVALGNDTPQLVRRGRVELAPGSHHLIVYRMGADAGTWDTPRECTAFSGVAGAAPAMLMAQAASSELAFPDGVGLEIDAHQIVRLEEHFINTTAAPIQGTGTVSLDAIDPVAGVIRAGMFFWGPLGIQIAPHSAGAVDYFHRVRAGVNIFALSTHQHHFGTRATVSVQPDATTPGMEVYRNTSWSEPPIQQFDPPLAFDGAQGVAVRCEWFNTSSSAVQWGESASTDEMCFVGGYYYPSHGFEYCVDDVCGAL